MDAPGTDQDPRIAEAIRIVGSQAKLALACECAQQHIAKLLNKQRRITGEMAARIHNATGGEVSMHSLRPDLFPAGVEPSSASAEAAA